MDTLTPEVLLVIGGVVTMVVQGVKQVGLSKPATLATTAGTSLLAVLVYMWSKGTFSRETTWDILVGIITVYTTAVAAYETLVQPAANAFSSGPGGTSGGATRIGLVLLAAGLLFAPACGKRYAPGTTVTQAMAYELDEGLKPLAGTQKNVIAAVDAACLPVGQPANPEQCKALKPAADRFLAAADKLFKLVRDEVSPRLKQLDAAIVAVDAARQGTLRAELVPLFGKLNSLAQEAFGVSLPDGLVDRVTTLAGKSYATFTQLRDGVRALIDKIRGDALGGTVPAPTAAAI